MAPASVGVLSGAAAGFVTRQRVVWASLPLSLVEDRAHPQLVAVDGTSPSWPTDLLRAIESEVRGIVVVEPTGHTSAEVVRHAAGVAASSDVAVTVHREWAGHPAVAGLAGSTAGFPEVVVLADSVVTLADTADWRSVLGAQLAVLRALGVPMTSVAFAAHHSGYTVHGGHSAGAVAMSARRSAVDSPLIRTSLYGVDGDVHLDVWATGNAAPAHGRRIDAHGATEEPAWYESAARASWRRLDRVVQEAERPSDLEALADDLDTVAQIVEQW